MLRKARGLVEPVDLDDREDAHSSERSGGQEQRVRIARGLMPVG